MMARPKNSDFCPKDAPPTLASPPGQAAPAEELPSPVLIQAQALTPEDAQASTLPAGGASAPRGVGNLPPDLRDHPRYRIIQLIGHGGMGDVYIAEHRLMGRIVALKTIRLDFAHDDGLLERFQREIRATAKLDHLNIVAVFDAEQTADSVFLAMEYLQGEDLWSLVHRRGPLDPKTALALLHQATEGVRHAHERGVIHRDIKPNNLFLVRSNEPRHPGTIKVLDFGLAKFLHDAGRYQHGTPLGFAMGTAGYMPPEQEADARSVGIQADIFSLGRTLYYLLSGEAPYRNGLQSLMAELSGKNPVIPLDQVCPGIPSEVVDLVERMTAARSELRPQSCAEVLSLLATLRHA